MTSTSLTPTSESTTEYKRELIDLQRESTEDMEYAHRHTKIVFTIGPATEEAEILQTLIREQVDICRLNMAHGTHEWTQKTIRAVREASAAVGREIAVMMDIKGPEIRTGVVEGSWVLETGEAFDLYVDPKREASAEGEVRGVSVNYPGLANDVHVGDTVLVDNGLIQLRVKEKMEDRVRCEVEISGPLTSKRHINLPGVDVNLPALTDKDRADMEVGLEVGLEFIALSFVRRAEDVRELRAYLKERGSKARIISKIEDQTAISNLEAIIEESDGLMVARGDLGIECPFEQLPLIQRQAVETCINKAKPVIVATHMLESMITAAVPTRAEVTDIANAVLEQADAIMLSGETTIGKYPLKCVEVMKRVSYEVEKTAPTEFNKDLELVRPKDKMLRSAVVLAQELEQTGIMVVTSSGRAAQLISSLRPTRCPLYMVTDDVVVARQLRLLWGVEPFYMDFLEDRNATIEKAIEGLKQKGKMSDVDNVIVLTNVKVGDELVDTIQLRKLED